MPFVGEAKTTPEQDVTTEALLRALINNPDGRITDMDLEGNRNQRDGGLPDDFLNPDTGEMDPWQDVGDFSVQGPDDNGEFSLQQVVTDENGDAQLYVPGGGFLSEDEAWEWLAQQTGKRVSDDKKTRSRARGRAESAPELRGKPGPHPEMEY